MHQSHFQPHPRIDHKTNDEPISDQWNFPYIVDTVKSEGSIVYIVGSKAINFPKFILFLCKLIFSK